MQGAAITFCAVARTIFLDRPGDQRDIRMAQGDEVTSRFIGHLIVVQRDRADILLMGARTYEYNGEIFRDVMKTFVSIGVDNDQSIHAAMADELIDQFIKCLRIRC